MPTNGETYKHYKGNLYQVIGIGRHSETLENTVVYKYLHDNQDGQIWIRPLDMWDEMITVDGEEKKRFQLVK